MTRGFYTLGSSMLTQNRTLSTISNNMANVKTPGFKRDTMLTETFGEMVMHRIDSNSKTALGNVSFMRTASEATKIHSQGTLIPSERNLDFAIIGEGFFAVTNGDQTVYTRNGSFNVDNEGYLVLPGTGRVQDSDGEDIYLGTDKVTSDEAGNVFGQDGELLATIPTYNFEDYNTLLTVGEGMYSAQDPQLVEGAVIYSKNIEGSNVDVGKEMTNTIATQRILQSVSQSFRMYDRVMESATTQIGRL